MVAVRLPPTLGRQRNIPGMTESDAQIVSTLATRAAELGVRFTSPYVLVDDDGTSYGYLGLVHEFGAPTGTLIGSRDTCPSGSVREREFALSLLDPSSPGLDSRMEAIEMFADWGWCGPAEGRPTWLPK
jgi:hypothetical protein